MTTKLWTPPMGLLLPKPPSYVKLDMAFGIGSGTTLFDKSRYRSHGTISGASWATGLHGKALDFVGATPSYVEIAAAYDQLNFTSEDFSIIMRVYLDDISGTREFLRRGSLQKNGYEFYHDTSGIDVFRVHQEGANQYSYGPSDWLTAGVWYTLGITRDGDTASLYKNGVYGNIHTGTLIDPASCSTSLKIGVDNDKASYPFDGKMEFLRVFGGIALSASEHLAWHNALK